MAKKIELLHTTYDESGNIESQEVVHPLTSPDCIIMENGKTLDEVMGDGIATPTLTHEGTSFKVGVGDSNIEVVDGDVAGMTLKGQSYQNILPKPTTLIMETDEKEFKINDKIDSNIIIDDNIAEIATVKGKTIVNVVQEESASEYTVLGEDLSGQSIVTTNKPEGNIKGVTLQGQTLVNTIQEPCKDDYVVLGADDGIEISAETGGHGTIEDTIGGSIKSAILKGQTLVNICKPYEFDIQTTGSGLRHIYEKNHAFNIPIQDDKQYSIWIEIDINEIGAFSLSHTGATSTLVFESVVGLTLTHGSTIIYPCVKRRNSTNVKFSIGALAGSTEGRLKGRIMVFEGDIRGFELSYFTGMKSVKMPVLTTVGKNLLNLSSLSNSCSVRDGGYYIDVTPIRRGNNYNIFSETVGLDTVQQDVSNFIRLKPNTTYTLSMVGEASEYVSGNVYNLDGNKITGTTILTSSEPSKTFTTTENAIYFAPILAVDAVVNKTYTIIGLQLEEGSTATSYEPYQSSTVTTEKNLFDGMLTPDYLTDSTGQPSGLNGSLTHSCYTPSYIPIQANEKFRLRVTSDGSTTVGDGRVYFYDKDYNYLNIYVTSLEVYTNTFSMDAINTVPNNSNIAYMRVRFFNGFGVQADSVKINKVYELRAIGEVKDELDLQTGKLTQRVGEVVLDGGYKVDWYTHESQIDGTQTFYVATNNFDDVLKPYGRITSNFLPKGETWNKDYECIELQGVSGGYNFRMRINKSRLPEVSIKGLNLFLQSNPITVQYELATPIIKTIDLQVTDQDGNTIPHIQTQPTVTHITASSDYLIPTVTIDNNLAYDTIIKPSTLYTVRFKHDTVNADNPLTVDLGGTVQTVTSTEFTITTPSELTHNQLVFSGKNNVVSEVQVIEGNVTNIEYPFFEGMSDVKFSDSKFIARGKNLVRHLPASSYYGFTIQEAQGSSTIINGSLTADYRDYYIVGTNENTHLMDYFNKMKVGETIHFNSNIKDFAHHIAIGKPKQNTTYVVNKYTKQSQDEVLLSMFIRFTKDCSFNNNELQIQIEIDSTSTPYEPYKGVEVQQDVDSIPLTSDMFEQGYYDYDKIIKGMSIQQIPLATDSHYIERRIYSKSLIKVKPNSRYKVVGGLYGWFLFFDKNGNNTMKRVGSLNGVITNEFTTDSNTHYVGLVLHKENNGVTITPSDIPSDLILQEVPQEIVLRGIGDVKDELDLTRGEYIQRIYDYTFTGEEEWYSWPSGDFNSDDTYAFHIVAKIIDKNFPLTIMDGAFVKDNDLIISNLLPTTRDVLVKDCSTEGIVCRNADPNYIGIKIKKDKIGNYDAQAMKAWVKSLYNNGNPLKIQFALETPIIHKVNLTNTKVIPSYATETHYETITPSDSLIPNITIPSTLNYNVAIKPSTKYTIRANTSDNLTVDLGGVTGTLSNGKVTLTTPATLTHNEVKFSGTGKVKELMVVEGNEIKDNVPFFNGMKDVQMGGIKLVNHARYNGLWNNLSSATNNRYVFNGDGTDKYGIIYFNNETLKPNTLYTIYMIVETNTSTATNAIKVCLGDGTQFKNISNTTIGIVKLLMTSPSIIDTRSKPYITMRKSGANTQVVIQNPMIIEGDWTHLDEIPYIESEMIIEQPIIRSQGKNLFDGELEVGTVNSDTGLNMELPSRVRTKNYIKIKPNTSYSLQTSDKVTINRIYYFDSSKKYISNQPIDSNNTNKVFPQNAMYIRLSFANQSLTAITNDDINNIKASFQLEEGSTATSYEPYKHQTLYSNRVIGYEDGCYYTWDTGTKASVESIASVMSDVEGLNVAYVTHASSNFSFYDKDGVYLSGSMYLSTATDSKTDNNFDRFGFITIPANAKYMKMACGNASSAAAKDYHLKATVTGELPLRSLPNGVCDTLNLVTGEYVQRVGEVVLDGSQKDESWLYNETNQTLRIYIEDVIQMQDSLSDPLRYEILVSSDKLTSKTYVEDWNSGTFISLALGKRIVLRIEGITTTSQLTTYLKQNPITVQYKLATPIVRKLGFTTKGNYSQANLATDCEWGASPTTANNTFTTRYRTTNAASLPIVYNTHLFSNDFTVRYFNVDAHQDYEYISNMEYGQYVNVRRDKLEADTVEAFNKWLQHNPIEVGYITSAQSSESYSNIHKPIFFNDVNVQYLPNNVDIQPELTYQVRTRNSYVMDMMKPNTTYTMKCLAYSNSAKLYVANSSANTSVSSNKTLQFAQSHLDGSKNELVLVGKWYEPMIIEGDVTGKNLPYFKGILSSYHDVDEVEIYSVNKNLFDMSRVKPYEGRGTYWWNTIVKENEVVSVRIGDINNGQFGAYIKLDVRPNSVYTLYIEMEKDGEPYNGQIYGYENDDLWGNGTFTGYANTPYHISTSHNAKYITIGFNYGKDFPIGTKLVSKNMRLYLGEESSVYIPHAHSTTLIEMPTRLETVKVVRPELIEGALEITNGAECTSTTEWRSNFIPVQPNEFIKVRNGSADRLAHIDFYDINKNFIGYSGVVSSTYVPNSCHFIRFFMSKSNCSDLTITRQAWKPIQLNSLPNGVRDEIIMKPNSNKAQLVQRVGKVVLDGNAPYYKYDINSNAYCQWYTDLPNAFAAYVFSDTLPTFTERTHMLERGISGKGGTGYYVWFNIESAIATTESVIKAYLQENPITVYYELTTPIIHEIQLKGYPHVYENGTVTLNTDTPHQTLVSYNVNQEQLINTQNETIIRHDQQIDDLYYYIEMYLEEIYQMELFRMKLELSL